jgi:cytochrome c oxidase assembly protein subunit 15
MTTVSWTTAAPGAELPRHGAAAAPGAALPQHDAAPARAAAFAHEVSGAPPRRVGWWLAVWAAMLFLTVLVGGATRLTESGLSITEWRPITGVVPPLTAEAWADAFAKYQRIPEFRTVHAAMTLPEFQRIYLWEYGHRLWARLVGLAFAVPLVVFWRRHELTHALRRRLALLLGLVGVQGAMGWYMVQSGLTERTDVSQYRLAAHLALALVIYAVTVWSALEVLRPRARSAATSRHLRRCVGALVGFAFLTAVSGAFVAGLDAGKIFNTFPLMAGQLVPPGWGALAPWYRNPFENPVAVQFDHRVLAMTLVGMVLTIWLVSRRAEVGGARRALDGLLAAALLQVGLGIATLLLHVPVTVAVLHQGGAVLLLTLALMSFYALGGQAEAWR